MAITQNGDIFVPQAIGPVATDILFEKDALLRSGYVVNAANSIWGMGGNTVTFPIRNTTTTGMVQDQVSNSRTGVTPSKVSYDTYTETLKNKTVSIDFAKNVLQDASSYTDINRDIAQDVARLTAADIQNSLITSAESTGLELDVTGQSTKTITVDYILEAKMKRGEYAYDGTPAVFLHTKQFTDLAKTADFKTLSGAYNNTLVKAGDQVPAGAVAMVHGVWIIVLDSVTVTAGSPDEYTGLMVWPNSLGLFIKQDLEGTLKDVHAGSNVATLDFDFRYCTTLFRNNPRGVVKIVSQ